MDNQANKEDAKNTAGMMAFQAMLEYDPKRAKAHLTQLTDDQLQDVHYACTMMAALVNTVWHLR